MDKDFNGWSKVKQNLDSSKRLPTFAEREIWWCSIGINVGYEVFGKNENFVRPVLILDKHNKHTFFGVPFGSNIKDNKYYFPFPLKGRDGGLFLSQARTFSCKRLMRRMEKISPDQHKAVINAFKNVL